MEIIYSYKMQCCTFPCNSKRLTSGEIHVRLVYMVTHMPDCTSVLTSVWGVLQTNCLQWSVSRIQLQNKSTDQSIADFLYLCFLGPLLALSGFQHHSPVWPMMMQQQYELQRDVNLSKCIGVIQNWWSWQNGWRQWSCFVWSTVLMKKKKKPVKFCA